MRPTVLLLVLTGLLTAQAKAPTPQTLRAVLLEQLRTTHDQKDWFVPVNVAIEGLTPEQAKWTGGHGNHSIGQLVNHLAFWNGRELQKLKGEKPRAYDGNNDETFNDFDSKTWASLVKNLDSVMKELEQVVESAPDEQLKTWASEIAHIGTHNAYHTGQIVYIRRSQGSWDPAKGVK
jgi:uncharacterized damage-inducible protein DinB